MQLDKLLQSIVAIDHPPVEVIQIGSGETPSIQGHQRAELRRDHRNHIQNHPFRLVSRLSKGIHHLEAFGELELFLLGRLGLHSAAEIDGQFLDIDLLQELLDRLGAHQGRKLVRILLHHLSILLFAEHFLFVQGSIPRIQNHVGLEVEDTLQLSQAQVQQMSDSTRQTLEEPYMGAGTGQFDVAETLPPHLGQRDLDTALVADHSPVLHPFVLPAKTLPIGDGAEDLGAEQTVALRLEGSVVDGLRFGDFTLGPGSDRVRRSQTDSDAVEIRGEVSPVMRVWSKH